MLFTDPHNYRLSELANEILFLHTSGSGFDRISELCEEIIRRAYIIELPELTDKELDHTS